jgi:S-adenosyl methyltransferase
MPSIYASQFLTDVMSTRSADYGVRQFLETGTGLPTADNTHEVARQVALTSRIVYVDNDPAVLSHARALLTTAP